MKPAPAIVVGIGVVFTSLSAILIRFSSAPPLAIAAYRMVFTTLILAPFFLRDHRRSGSDQPADGSAGEMRRAILLSVLSGGFLSLHFATWITSLSYTSVASSTVLVNTHPVVVGVAGALILGDRVTLRSGILMATALIGSAVLVWSGFGDGESTAFGNMLAILGALTVSGYMIIGRAVRQTMGATRYTFIVYSVAAALLIIYALVGGVPLFPYSARELLIFLGLAVFCTLLGHSLFNWALRFLKPSVVSTAVLGEPVIASILAAVLFGEMPAATTLAGGAIILVSVFFFARNETRRTPAP